MFGIKTEPPSPRLLYLMHFRVPEVNLIKIMGDTVDLGHLNDEEMCPHHHRESTIIAVLWCSGESTGLEVRKLGF